MPKKVDPLAQALDGAAKGTAGGATQKVLQLFGDRPEALQSILRARSEKKLSWAQISKIIVATENVYISPGALQNWCLKQGVT
jgi:hypothetical protein